jgi:hypothetical protein
LESNPIDSVLDVKRRFTEEQIIDFLRKAEATVAQRRDTERQNSCLVSQIDTFA